MARTIRIATTGGGTGGHFYPLVAVWEELLKKSENSQTPIAIRFFSTDPYDSAILQKFNIPFVKVMSGKRRTYFSPANFIDLFKIFFGCVSAFFKLLFWYPDIVFGKGGYASFPTLFAARILRIPVIIHESDTIPGRVNMWAGKFATRIALSFPDAMEYFPKDKTAVLGQPIRRALTTATDKNEALRFFSVENSNTLPILTVVGGSQGAQRINEMILDLLPTLLEHYIIIHQTGDKNAKEVADRAALVLGGSDYAARYHAFPFFSEDMLSKLGAITRIFISRAGSMLFEFAAWGVPSILIPLPETISRDQTRNAFSYARAGCALVLEEKNLTPHVFLAALKHILENDSVYSEMVTATHTFAKAGAAGKIADEILHVATYHE